MRIDECPVRATANVIGGKWKPLILYSLKAGTRRYGELRRTIPDAPKKVLTDQLRELEQDGIVLRNAHRQRIGGVEYSLTSYGKTLAPILRLMATWGEKRKKLRLKRALGSSDERIVPSESKR
jgi:DNA-binding HxlR family transcriptional regulator